MTTVPAPPESKPAQHDPSWGLLFVLAGNMLIDALEVSVVLVALPTIAASFGLSPFEVQWVMSGFALGFAALLLLGPGLTARWGRRRSYLIALVVFALASVVGGVTGSIAVLVMTRVLKGACAALTAPTGLSIIATAFPEGPRRRRAVSIYSLFGAAGFTVGLLLSGALVAVDWHWVFAIPAPVAVVLLLFAARLIPADPADRATPRFRFELLRIGALVRSALGAATLNGTYLGLLLLTTFALQHDRGWAAWQTALAFLPACLPLAISAPFTGRMVARFGAARLIALGATAPALGYGYQLVPLDTEHYAIRILPTLLLVGAGFVLSFGALNMRATAEVPEADRQLAVPLYQSAVQLGAVLMLSLVAGLHTAFGGTGPALALITAVGALGVLVAVIPARPAERSISRKGDR